MSLRSQGDENTVDAVHMLVSFAVLESYTLSNRQPQIRAVCVYMLEYGDSRDPYLVNKSQYESELDVARQYAHQKVWPRAIYVRRARSEYATCCFTRDSLTHFI